MPFAVPFADRTADLLGQFTDPAPAPAPPIPEPVHAAVEAALDRGETHYTDRPGILPLRRRISELLRERFGVTVDADRDVLVTCGATEARFAAIQQLLQPGESLAAPQADPHVTAAVLLRRAVLTTELGPDARLVYLTSSRGEAALRGLLARIPDTATILYEADEPASRFHPAQLPGLAARTLTLGGLEAASWRMGYLAGGGSAAERLRDFKQALTICSTNLSQWAVLAALESAA